MQALIDFDGWRKWKDFAAPSDSSKDQSETGKDTAGAGKKKKDLVGKDGVTKDKIAGLKKDSMEDGAKIGESIKENSQSSTPSNA